MLSHSITSHRRSDGALIIGSGLAIGPITRVASDWLRHWSETAPERTFLAERAGAGWRRLSYGAAYGQVQSLAAGLLARGLGPDKPLMILSGNSVDYGLISLAAHHVGIPTVPLAEQYALIPEARPRLQHALDLTRPGAVFAQDADAFAAAIEFCGRPAITDLSELMSSPGDVSDAHAATGPDSIAKILMTSGSTSSPKGVVTTQKMMTTNQAQLQACLPFLRQRPPVLVDWLPWNHVFGGSHNFNMVLANGGTLYIDDGKPLPALFPRTLENLALASPSISFNVPMGYAQLVRALKADAALRRSFFEGLDMLFYAGTDLPQETWAALEQLARQEGTAPLINSSWGLTETSPAAALQYERVEGESRVGVPLPGVTLKLLPLEHGRYEARVKGASVFERYLNAPQQTDAAFDEEGFFITGDAMRFADAQDPARGLRFDGRLSEDFKLTSGTWVRATALRLEVMELLSPLASDVVLCGAGQDSLGLLIFPNPVALEAAGLSLSVDGDICAPMPEIMQRLKPATGAERGSARRIRRALIVGHPPNLAAGEITAKGNLNIPRILSRRADLVKRLYSDDVAVMTF